MYHFIVSVGQKSSCDITSFSVQGVTELSQDAGWAILSFGAQNPLPIFLWVLGRIQFLGAVPVRSPFSCWLGVVVCYHFKKLLMIFDMRPPAFSKLAVEYCLLCFELLPSEPT